MGILIGYARVSTGEQNLDLQIDALQAAGCERTRIYTDELSGVKVERPGLQEAWRQLRTGDTLVVWRLDRLGRSIGHPVSLDTRLGYTAGVQRNGGYEDGRSRVAGALERTAEERDRRAATPGRGPRRAESRDPGAPAGDRGVASCLPKRSEPS
jgi:hypothetical protein